MKKLFFSLLALMLCITASAQKPTPKFSDLATDGATVQYLYNVEAGGFLLGANDWNTRASVSTDKGYKFKVAANGDGTYTLNDSVDTQSTWKAVFADNSTSIWVDNLGGANVKAWGIEPIEGTQTFYITNSAAAEGYLACDPALADSRLYLSTTLAGKTWAAVNAEDYVTYYNETLPAYYAAQKQTTDKTVDIASSFDALNPNGLSTYWTCDGTINGAFHTNTWSTEGKTDGSGMTTPFFERWVGGGATLNACDMHTTLSGLLPNSKYKLSALFRVLFENGGVEVNNVSFYAGEKSVDVCENGTAMNKGKYGTFTVKGITDAEGNLTVGVKVLEGTTASWVTWKNMTLNYFGSADDPVDRTALQAAIEEVSAYTAVSPKVAEDIKAALEAAQAVYDDANTDEDDVDAAVLALNKAFNAAKSYDAAGDVLAQMKQLTKSTNFYTEETYKAYYADYQEKFDAGTLTDTEIANLHNPYTITGWHGDLTAAKLLLPAWKIGDVQCEDFKAGMYINTWSTEGETDGSGFKVPFFEYWTGDANALGANTLTGTVTGLEAGDYTVSAWVRVRLNNNSTDQTATGITFNGVDACAGAQVGTSQFRLMKVTAPATVGEDGVLTAQFVIADGNNISWLSFQNVNYEPAIPYTYATYDFDPLTAVSAGVRTYAKDIVADSGETSGLNEVEGWAHSTTGDAMAAGVFAYASEPFLGGTGYVAPATDPEAQAGNALGIVAVWGATAQYTKEVELPAGVYQMIVPVYNAGGTASVTNMLGYNSTYSTTKYAEKVWTVDTLTISLPEAATINLSLGYKSANSGSGSNPHLFYDRVAIEKIGSAEEAMAVVKDAALASLDALTVGEGLFYYNAESVAAAKAAIEAASTVADVEAAKALAKVNAPVEGQLYVVKNKTANGNLSVNTEAASVTVETGAKVYFTAVEGGYAISNEDGTYIFKTTSNNWTLSTTTELADAYVLNANIVEGGYTLQGSKGCLGTDATTTGATVWADKNASKNGVWTIEVYDAEQETRNATLAALIAAADSALNAGQVIIKGDGLITSVEQLSSPYTEPSEGSLDNLLDGDASTFWHSAWSSGSVAEGVHYLEIALPEGTTGDIELDMTRRSNADSDHITKADIIGVNADGTTELIESIELPFGSKTETVTADFTLEKAYSAIRILEQGTTSNRGYWHAGEIQLYPISLDPTCANAQHPDEAAALGEAIETAEAVENATQEDIDALQKAYDAYVAAATPAEIAEFVSVTPEAGSNVDMDTEYTVTFSKPVTFSTSMSDICIGEYNSLTNNNGVNFTLSEDQKTITAKLDPTFLSMLGISNTDDLVSMLGNTLALRIYKVKDVATGETLEGNDPEEDYQFTFNYTLGKPTLSIQTQDGRTEEVSSISTLYFACNEGVALADATKSILVMRNKEQVATITADQLVAAGSDIDPMDEGDDDNFGVDTESAVQYYSYTFAEALTETGSYEVYVPAGMFLVGGAENETIIGTFLIKGEPTGIEVDPAAGEVESLQNFTFTYNMNEMISPSSQEGTDLTITDADGNVVATITQDDLNMAIDESCLDETGWNVIKCKASLAEAITAPGTYTLHIPAAAFYVGDNYDNCEATDFVYTIKGAAELTWSKSAIVANNFGDKESCPVVTVEYYEETSTYVIKNWAGVEGQDLTITVDEDGYSTTINGSEGEYNEYYFGNAVTAPCGNGTVDVMLGYNTYLYDYTNPYASNKYNAFYLTAITEDGLVTYIVCWDDDTVGIKNLDAATRDAIYNMAGQRVSKAGKGVYIKNGKKYLMK